MLKLIAAAALVSTTVLGATAMAQTGQSGQSAGLKQLSWQQLQSACQNPAAFQSQRAPNAIRLTCEGTKRVWKAEQTDTVDMSNSGQITASLSSDKYYIIRHDQDMSLPDTVLSCPRLREYQETYTQSFSLSCQEIQNFQGNMNDFCQARLDTAVKGNPQLSSSTATGRVYNMCAAPELVTEAPGQQPAQPTQNGGKAAPAPVPAAQPALPKAGGGQVGGARPGIGGQVTLPGFVAGSKSR